MERIRTLVMPAAVEIDGKEYRIAERTVAVEEELLAAQKSCAGMPAHRLYLAELEILLGRKAVKKLFAGGRSENVDRMQQIHAGVCAAFERSGNAVERERTAQRAEVWSDMTAALEPINELLRQLARLEAEHVIRRPARQEEGEAWQKV